MDLGKDIPTAISTAKHIIRGYVEASPVKIRIKMGLVGGKIITTNYMYMRTYNEKKIDDLEEFLFEKYLAVVDQNNPEPADKIELLLEKIEKKECLKITHRFLCELFSCPRFYEACLDHRRTYLDQYRLQYFNRFILN